MSRSLSHQLEIALVRANKAEAENRDLKAIINDRGITKTALQKKIFAYCKIHNVKSVSKEELDAWSYP